MVNISSSSLLTGLFSTSSMESVFSATQQIQCMLRFEVALSGALEDCGLIPIGSAEPMQRLLQTDFLTPQRAESLISQAKDAGNLAIPFVRLLTEEVLTTDQTASRSVHLGATSQDVLDTALVLQLRQALDYLRIDLGQLKQSCVSLAKSHAQTIMPGRTWLQQGPPVTFGLKLAGWAAVLDRHQVRIRQTSERAIVLQFGGAVGTLASLHKDGLRVATALARRLDLPEASLPWHTHRDNLAELATTLGLLTGSLGKIARDISLLMQTEIAEVFEPSGEGRGGSSTMPHKRNPVSSAAILAASLRVPGLVSTMLSAMPQEHERGLGGWQAEWETLPQIFCLTAGALAQTNETVSGLKIHPDRMEANLQTAQGLTLAEAVSAELAKHAGRQKAHRLLEEACRKALDTDRPLLEVLCEDPAILRHLSREDLTKLLDPCNYLGCTQDLIQRTLEQLCEKGD